MNKSHSPNTPEIDSHAYLILYDRPIRNRHSFSVDAWEDSAEDLPYHTVFQDVTELPDAALSFAMLLLKEQVSPRHLADIIEDALPLK